MDDKIKEIADDLATQLSLNQKDGYPKDSVDIIQSALTELAAPLRKEVEELKTAYGECADERMEAIVKCDSLRTAIAAAKEGL